MQQYVYFIYSETQEKQRKSIEKQMSRVFHPGIVYSGGKKYQFTEISKTSYSRYPDAKIVAEGYKDKMRYTNVSSTF